MLNTFLVKSTVQPVMWKPLIILTRLVSVPVYFDTLGVIPCLHWPSWSHCQFLLTRYVLLSAYCDRICLIFWPAWSHWQIILTCLISLPAYFDPPGLIPVYFVLSDLLLFYLLDLFNFFRLGVILWSMNCLPLRRT